MKKLKAVFREKSGFQWLFLAILTRRLNMKLRTARIVVWSLIGMAALFGLTALIAKSSVAVVLMAVTAAIEVIIVFVFVKCPHCGRHLDRAGMKPDIEYCPFCGESLNDGDGQHRT